MCGIGSLIRALYEDLVDAFNQVLPQASDEPPPFISRPRQNRLAQPLQRGLRTSVTSGAQSDRIANRRSAGRRQNLETVVKLPSPPRTPPTRNK
ncbi:hypothetical protein FZEAL_875 [Fusarium zealandicum]|uniref:Uncharacterized protein n=1 Tax=Fusarium zealandicum TaxID=1053134 RepID=A0A8H4XQ03_9HYPO|nr:hypothetical protein FZEAL_875 [Fusarium zealandicum]